MGLVLVIQAVLLGIVEGLTEFIPVSSTGHLILLVDMLKFEGPQGAVFEISIQMGAILAVCYAYFGRLWGVATTLKQQQSQRFVLNLLIAFMPAAVIGVLAHSVIKELLFSVTVVSWMLVIGGVLILLIERMQIVEKHTDVLNFSPLLALKIGFCQVLAMVPGTSRSGATIMGARLLGVSRKSATEFSFFLAIPTMLGATVYDLYKNRDHLVADDMGLIAIGFFAAFIAALLVVKSVIAFIERHGFTPFGYYRIALGCVMLALIYG